MVERTERAAANCARRSTACITDSNWPRAEPRGGPITSHERHARSGAIVDRCAGQALTERSAFENSSQEGQVLDPIHPERIGANVPDLLSRLDKVFRPSKSSGKPTALCCGLTGTFQEPCSSESGSARTARSSDPSSVVWAVEPFRGSGDGRCRRSARGPTWAAQPGASTAR